MVSSMTNGPTQLTVLSHLAKAYCQRNDRELFHSSTYIHTYIDEYIHDPENMEILKWRLSNHGSGIEANVDSDTREE